MTTVNELVLSIVKMTPAERFNIAFKVAESIGYRLVPISQSPRERALGMENTNDHQ